MLNFYNYDQNHTLMSSFSLAR